MDWNYRFISRLPENFNDEDILFIKQLGIDYTYYSLPIADHNYPAMKALVDRIEAGGLKMEFIQSNLFTFNWRKSGYRPFCCTIGSNYSPSGKKH